MVILCHLTWGSVSERLWVSLTTTDLRWLDRTSRSCPTDPSQTGDICNSRVRPPVVRPSSQPSEAPYSWYFRGNSQPGRRWPENRRLETLGVPAESEGKLMLDTGCGWCLWPARLGSARTELAQSCLYFGWGRYARRQQSLNRTSFAPFALHKKRREHIPYIPPPFPQGKLTASLERSSASHILQHSLPRSSQWLQ